MDLLKSRLSIALFFSLLAFIAFSARLFYLQIYKGEEYRSFSERNILRIIELPAPRGRVFDRNGEKVLYNKPSFNVRVFPKEIGDADKLAKDLSQIINTPKENLGEKLRKAASLNNFYPVTIAKDISREELLLFEKNKEGLKGAFLELGHKRFYPHGEAAAVFLGYTGTADAEEIRADHRIKAESRIGKTGVEKVFDGELRGTNGLEYIMVDAHGKVIPDSFSALLPIQKNKEMVPGKDIYLTIDAELQRVADRALGKEKGAVIAMDVRTGEILTMVSRPSYRSEDISKWFSQENRRKRKEKEHFSLFNRSTQGTYAPGSVLKIITAFALLEEKIADPGSSVYCPGYYLINGKRFNCWQKEGHGHVDLLRAIVESCDVYFYKRSLKLGVNRLHTYMKRFGVGERTGIVLPEKHGVNPSKAWKRKHLKEPWYTGETAMFAIGQGYVTTTPLQISVMTAAIANGGAIVIPKIRKTDEKAVPGIIGADQRLDAKSVSFLKKALFDAVNSYRGTGIYARSKTTSISGKTGTAQVVSAQVELTQKRFKDHAWFTSYAPSDSAEIAVTVLVENGGSGSVAAAPIAKKVIETYFRLKKERDETRTAKSE